LAAQKDYFEELAHSAELGRLALRGGAVAGKSAIAA
jgi:hypothetical protein